MSQLYDSALSTFQADSFSPEDELPDPPDLPKAFHSDVMSPNTGEDALDRAISRYILRWHAEQDEPFFSTNPALYTGCSVTRRSLEGSVVDFFDRLTEQHGRPTALYHLVRLGCSNTHDRLLDARLSDYQNDDPSVMRDELYEALTHRNAETGRALSVDGPDTKVGEAVLAFFEMASGKREVIRPIDSMPGHGGSDYETIYRTVLIEPGWSDYRRACLLLEPTIPGEVNRRYDKRDNVFDVIHRNHNGETFRAGPDADPDATDVERTKSVLQTIQRWIDEDRSAIQKAITGLSGEDYDCLRPAFRHNDQRQLEMWVEAGGNFRAYELYRAAEDSLDNPEPVRFVLQHYDADEANLTKAFALL